MRWRGRRLGCAIARGRAGVQRRHRRARPAMNAFTRGVHHLALCTDDMKKTVDFYVEVLGMPLVHAMKVPPGLGTGPKNRGNPPYENIRHYFCLLYTHLRAH